MGVIKFKKKGNWIGKKQAEKSILSPSMVVDMPRRVRMLPPPTHNPNGGTTEKALYDEQQVARVENLMLKGVRDRRMLMGFLGIEHATTMDRYMSRVAARWELVGADTDMLKMRGELLRKLDNLEMTTWEKFDDRGGTLPAKDDVAYLKTLIAINAQRAEVLGISAATVAAAGSNLNANTSEFSHSAASHERLTLLAGRMMDMIENPGKFIEGKVVDDGESPPET